MLDSSEKIFKKVKNQNKELHFIQDDVEFIIKHQLKQEKNNAV